VIASLILLHPYIAFGALFQLLSIRKLYKIYVILILFVFCLIVLTGVPAVIFDSAIQTKVLFAAVTGEISHVSIEEEDVVAGDVRAPRDVF